MDQAKQTLMKHLHVAARGKSFKAEDKELLRIGESWLRIETTIGDNKLVITLETGRAEEKKFKKST